MDSLDTRMRSYKILQFKVLQNSLEASSSVGMGNEYLRPAYLLGFLCVPGQERDEKGVELHFLLAFVSEN